MENFYSLETNDQNDQEDHIVGSLTAVGKHFQVTQPAVSRWKRNGMPTEPDGKYNLKKVVIWRALRVAKEANSLLPDKVEGFDVKLLGEIRKELGRFQNLAEIYKEKRGDVFAGIGAKILAVAEQILDGISTKKLKKMHVRDQLKSLKDLIASATSIYEKERLSNDQSTENIQLIVAQIKDLKRRNKEKREAEAKIKSLMVQDGNKNNNSSQAET